MVNRFGCRPVMMLGGLFASLGMILASFATSIIHIYFCTGVITGSSIPYLHSREKQTISQSFAESPSLFVIVSVFRSGSGFELSAVSHNAESIL